MKKTGQLTYKDRVIIQYCLEENITIIKICKKLGVSKQTIYREIKRIFKEKNNNKSLIKPNILNCKNRLSCEHLCNHIDKYYELCINKCDKYIQNYCDQLLKFPFCNKYIKKRKCRLNGKIYDANMQIKKLKTNYLHLDLLSIYQKTNLIISII